MTLTCEPVAAAGRRRPAWRPRLASQPRPAWPGRRWQRAGAAACGRLRSFGGLRGLGRLGGRLLAEHRRSAGPGRLSRPVTPSRFRRVMRMHDALLPECVASLLRRRIRASDDDDVARATRCAAGPIPLTAPAAIPSTMWRCAQRKTIRSGSDHVDRAGHHDAPLVFPSESSSQKMPIGQRPHVVGVGDDQRPEEVVPDVLRRQQPERHQDRHRERHHDRTERPQVAGPVHPGGVQDLSRAAPGTPAASETCRPPWDVRQDQGRVRVDQAQSAKSR